MINRNLPLQKDGKTYYVNLSTLDNIELDTLFNNNKGIVNISIKRPISKKTNAQMATIHALLHAFYHTGMHSVPQGYRESIHKFRLYYKLVYGPCYDTEINGMKVKVPLSMADYSKDNLSHMIKCVLTEIHESGAYAVSLDIRKIIEGLEV